MRWVWVGGSAAVACVFVAVALYLSDLETLSWIAGAGSFIITVPSLVMALTQNSSSSPDGFLPVRTDDQSQVSNKATEWVESVEESAPVFLPLTTSSMRINKRVAGAVKGMILCVALLVLALLGSMHSTDLPPAQAWNHMFQDQEAAVAWQTAVALPVFFGVIGALGSDWKGHDLLIVDIDSITVVDKRWIRSRDLTFSICWDRIQRIRVFAEPKGAHAVVVKFVDEKMNNKVGDQVQALVSQHNVTEQYDGYVIARLPRVSGDAERVAVLPRLRAALVRFGGSAYT